MGKLAEFYARPEIMITKETKKNTLTVNIRPGIYELQADPDSRAIHMLVDASSGGNIKPGQVPMPHGRGKNWSRMLTPSIAETLS